jgi:8-oxo-dGTP pyrophosphatase MutT (NUDIX family)
MRKVIKGAREFTASVWILTKRKPRKILLIHHKKYDKWIQPGGHIEINENPIECAIREIREETGVDIGFIKEKIKILENGDKYLPLPEFIIEQRIPPYGRAPEHFHIDLQYIVKISEQGLKRNFRESHGVGWFTKKEAFRVIADANTKLVLEKLM